MAFKTVQNASFTVNTHKNIQSNLCKTAINEKVQKWSFVGVGRCIKPSLFTRNQFFKSRRSGQEVGDIKRSDEKRQYALLKVGFKGELR